jgi:pyruvate dehydrogenase E2 component (dihydrolipoamide acetyltransferase)
MIVNMPTRLFSSYPDHLTLEMPALSPTMEKGNLGAWNKKVGDTIAPGDVLCSIETDKATIDYEMQDEGYIAKLLYPEGAKDIPLGSAMAIVVDNEEDIAKFADYTAEAGAATPAPAKAVAAEPTPAPAAPVAAAQPAAAAPAAPARGGDRVFASPVAQGMASAQGLSLASVAGTGPGGRIIKADVEDALAAGSQSQGHRASEPILFDSAPGIGYTDIENSQIRKVIADRLTYSKQNIPHYYVTVTVEMDNLMKLRAKLNKVASQKLSVNVFVMKAAALAALKVPATNSSWMEDFVR